MHNYFFLVYRWAVNKSMESFAAPSSVKILFYDVFLFTPYNFELWSHPRVDFVCLNNVTQRRQTSSHFSCIRHSLEMIHPSMYCKS